ncbi:MAG: N-6 DNA methylase [Pseudomonadota bacterium]
MYRVDRNNFYDEQKKATVYTPDDLSLFLFKLLRPVFDKDSISIFDPCVGKGSLLAPWKNDGFECIGTDIENQGFPRTRVANFLETKRADLKTKKRIGLVLMNPPFNIDAKTKQFIKENYSGRPLLPEVWLQKTIELFGTDIPIVMFTPYGFRLNQGSESKRLTKFMNGTYPPITSIVSLPKDVFPGVLFHSEVLMFNIQGVPPHQFYKSGLGAK